MSSRLVSIITPAHNAAGFLSATIQSVIDQTHREWEMLIVDDGSTDTTASLAKEWAACDPRIRLVHTGGNLGAGMARNHGLEQATGRYVAFLDADDLFHPAKLERQISVMEREGLGFSFTTYAVIDEEGRPIHSGRSVPRQIDYRTLLVENIIGCSTVVLDTNVVGPVRFSPRRLRQDFLLWLHLLEQGHVAHGIDQPLTQYRIRSHSLSSNKLRAARETFRLYMDELDLGWWRGSWTFFRYALNGVRKRWTLGQPRRFVL